MRTYKVFYKNGDTDIVTDCEDAAMAREIAEETGNKVARVEFVSEDNQDDAGVEEEQVMDPWNPEDADDDDEGENPDDEDEDDTDDEK